MTCNCEAAVPPPRTPISGPSKNWLVITTKAPGLVTEEELRAYFLHLTRVERCAPGTLKIALSGIKFCFAVTLQRQWPVLGLVRPGRERKLPVVLSQTEVRAVLQA